MGRFPARLQALIALAYVLHACLGLDLIEAYGEANRWLEQNGT